ncbi:MAG: sugar ABC transporter ATP-binding protein [Actinomycetota bacterium]|nr:sugar ABC transporter ATP-binding protein [Actinomycetota bacterium]
MNNSSKGPIVKMDQIVKTFYGVKALDNMTFDLYEGEIHSLVGENGAGKSTLMKVLSGAHAPDSGQIEVFGKRYTHMTAELSYRLGINIIYQESLLMPWMNVYENVYMGQEISKGGWVDFKQEKEKTHELCKQIGHPKLPLDKKIHELSVAEQQYVKIIKALSTNPKILIMDEPTSMFNVEDVKLLLNTVETIAAQGVSIIYISHNLKEVVQIADRITVIRDGSSIRTYGNDDRNADLNKLVNDMVGRPVSAFYEREEHEIGDIAFEVKDLVVDPKKEPISFNIRRGEIMGFAGMVGSGRTEIANAIVGASRKYGGKIIFNGKELDIDNPADSINYKIGYITEDRQGLGLMLDASVVENLTVVGLQTKIKQFFINVKNFIPLISKIIKSLNIKLASPMQEVKSLSGGNQQKVVLGKWLFTDSDMYIFDEPTRGIDVNAKSEFYKIISGLAAQGKVVMMISSDMPELISMSDRVTVVRKGKIVKTLESSEISENSIIRYALEVHKDEQ